MSEKLKYHLLRFSIVATTIPFLAIIPLPSEWTSANTKGIAQYFAAVLGYIGVSLLLWMYIIGARSVATLYFKDHPKLLKLHAKLGKYGVFLVFLHPLLTAYYYGENLLSYTLIPSISTEFEKHVTLGRISFMVLLVVWVTSALIRSKIAYRPWKYIHYIAYLSLPLAFLHVPEVGQQFDAKLIQFYWYYAIVIFLVITVLRLAQLFGFGAYVFGIKKIVALNESVTALQLMPQQKIIPVKKGQYIYLKMKSFGEAHPFSVLEYDPESGEITVAFKQFGAFTKKLAGFQIDDQLLVEGPFGIFTGDVASNDKAVFIAGGIGITPFVGHLINPEQSDYWLFYANQTKESAVFSETLKQRLGSKYVEILQHETSPAFPGSERGFINSEILSRYLTAPHELSYYICGPKGMMQATEQALLTIGVPENNIKIEEFGF